MPRRAVRPRKRNNRDITAHSFPAATYGLPGDTNTIVVPNLLLVRDDLDANLACVLTNTLFDRQPQLEQANVAAAGISLDTTRQTDPERIGHHHRRKAPHPGADNQVVDRSALLRDLSNALSASFTPDQSTTSDIKSGSNTLIGAKDRITGPGVTTLRSRCR